MINLSSVKGSELDISGNSSIGGNETVAGTLDIGSGTTKRAAPAGTFVNSADGYPAVVPASTVPYWTFQTDVTISTWESVGPTGSGMDNEWALLDAVPTDAAWIKLKFIGDATITGGTVSTRYVVSVACRKYNTSVSYDDGSIVGGDKAYPNSSGYAAGYFNTEVKIPLNSARFELLWTSTFTNNTMRVVIVGWGFNP